MPRARHRLVSSFAASAAIATLATACVIERGAVVPSIVDVEPALAATAEAEETALLARVDAYDDPDLTSYLASVVDRLLSEDERATDASTMTVTVLRDPSLSAFAMPTGRIFVHTGLLARLDNEAQLATILAREMTHVRRHHAATRAPSAVPIAEAVAAIARTIGTATVSPAGREEAVSAVLGPVFRAMLSTPLPIAYAAAVEGYGEALAREADAGAAERLVRASYDPKEASRAFEHLRHAARAGGAIERFFYGNETVLAERAEAVAPIGATEGAVTTAVATPDTFTAVLLPVLRDNAKLELAAGRFRLAQEQLDRALASAPEDAVLHLLYGDLYRLRAQRVRSVADQDELARKAYASYERCIALDPDRTEVQRQLGLLYYQLRQIDRARDAFARYLALRPDAPDAARVREYLVEPGR